MEEKVTRKQQAYNTKKKLLESAISLFKEYGYEKVTVEDICKKADVTTGAFYHHIKSKAGVVVLGYKEYDEYILKVCDIKENEEKTYVERILEAVCHQIDYVDYLGLEIITEVYKTQLMVGDRFFLSESRGIVTVTNELVEKAIENNELTGDSKEISREILIVARGIIYNWCQSGGIFDVRSLTEKMVRNYIEFYKVK